MAGELEPRTVYLPPPALDDAEARAADMSVAVGVVLRLVLLGKQPPLRTA